MGIKEAEFVDEAPLPVKMKFLVRGDMNGKCNTD